MRGDSSTVKPMEAQTGAIRYHARAGYFIAEEPDLDLLIPFTQFLRILLLACKYIKLGGVILSAAGAGGGAARMSFWRLLLFGMVAGVLAAVVNAVVYLLASAVGAIPESVVVSGGGPITLGAILVSSFVPALLAALFLAVLERFTRRAIGIFRVVAVVLLVLSLSAPLTIAGAPAAMILALFLMHIVAAGVIIWVLTVLAPSRS